MESLIKDINKSIINRNYSESLQISNDIYETFKKLIPVHKNLTTKELLVNDIFNKNSVLGNISLRKIKNIYEK